MNKNLGKNIGTAAGLLAIVPILASCFTSECILHTWKQDNPLKSFQYCSGLELQGFN